MNESILGNEEEIHIQNMVVTTSISDKLDLNLIHKNVPKSEYDTNKFPGLIYRQKTPKTAILLFTSGKVVCTGAKTLKEAEKAIANIIKLLSKSNLGIYKKPNIDVQNIVATSNLYTEFKLNSIAISLGLENVEYEPEQFPGLVYRVLEPKVVILIFSSGRIVSTGAKTVEDVTKAVKILKDDLYSRGLI